ncbi:ABC transporter permease [Oleiharenicola lentus]|uniref:ABC transporter permease n=1 Tax=Oleiharenicola lentus TaxID=2508720 RepID=UPI003F663B0F
MFLETFLQDLRIGLRVLVKEKGFCALAVFVLALGICSVTTIFSVVHGTMIRGFNFPNAERLVSVNIIDPTQPNQFGPASQIFALDYQEIISTQKSFEYLTGYINGSTVNATIDGNPVRFTGAYPTHDFFRTLGIRPIMGRDFTAEDNQPGAEKVAIISYQIWKREFGGVSDIIGKSLRINGKPATIVGVMPEGFAFPQNEQLWIPLFSEFPPRARNDTSAQGNGVFVIGALKPNVSIEQATAEMQTFAKSFSENYPDTNKQFNTGYVEPLLRTFTPRFVANILYAMLGFCGGVLLIACVNVMNMQFARATLRSKELAIRSSLGASRSRLIRQMLTESLLVASLGAIIGVGGAYWAVDLLTKTIHSMENPPPAYITFDINATVLLVAVGVTLAAALLSGLVPAWMSSRTSAGEALKESGRGNTSRTINLVTRGLVVFQIVLTCILLIGSILQLRSILKQQGVDYGYNTAGIMSARMGLMDGDYPNSQARRLFYDRLVQTLRANPEIEAAGLTNRFRMAFSGNARHEIEGREYKADNDRPNLSFEQISPGFFGVTEQRLVEGRDFNDADIDVKQPVAVVNATSAKKMFGNESALGRRFRISLNNGQSFTPWRTIIGVVTDVRMRGPFNNPNLPDDAGYYVPFSANLFSPTASDNAPQFATIAVRPRGGQPGEAVLAALRNEVKKVDPNLPLYFVNTPKANQNSFLGQVRINAVMFTIFGCVAVLLASVGLYGVMSFSVNQRTQEFGVRMALGADNSKILGMVLKQASVQIGLGLVIGVVVALSIAFIGGGAIQTVLFDISPHDPVTYLGVMLLLTVVSLIAALVPARRATQVDPMIALRAE